MQSSIIWDKCVLCQKDSAELLQCPAESNRKDVGAGYKTLASNISKFQELGYMPIPLNIKVLEEGNGIVHCLLKHEARWHKSCNSKFNKTELKRAEKRLSSSSEETDVCPKKYTRKSVQSSSLSSLLCFFCDKCTGESKEPLHSVSTMDMDNRIRQIALDLQEESLLAKLSAGDMVALEAKYHKSCLTSICNRARSSRSHELRANEKDSNVLHGIVLAELVSYIEDTREETNSLSVFKLSDLSKMYASRLEQLGIESTSEIHSTRLKNRIIARIPSIHAYQEGREILLAFDSDIGTALKRSQRDDSDNKASCLAKAASIVRKDMLEKKTSFTGTFEKNCQNDSIPQCLYSLVNMILHGPNIRKQAEYKSTQATLTVSQLLQFNSYFSNRSECSHHDHHNRCRETPLPIYLGLSIHARTRKRDLVDNFFKLGLSVSYDRVLSISTDIGNTICRKFEDENSVCPAKLRKGIFTTSAVDNIDHNPSSNTAKGSFHGTGISLFQNVSREYPGIEQEQISLEHRSKLDTKKVCELPDWYTDVPPCILRDANAHTTNNVTLRTDEDYLSIALQDEIEWLQQVKRGVEEETLPEGEMVSWSGYHASKQQQRNLKPAVSSLLQLFQDESKSVAMIRHSMNIIKKTTEHLNPGQVPVIAVDQPLFAVAKQIQWNWPQTHGEQNFVILLGGLHIEMVALKMLGDWLEDSGWTSALVEARIANPGVEIHSSRPRMSNVQGVLIS